MKIIKYTITMTLLLLSMSSCGIYTKYSAQTELDNNDIYGNIQLSADSDNLAMLPWKELFSDEKLQELIELGLNNNRDAQVALLRIDQAEASLKAAKLSFLPSFAVTPQGNANQFGSNSISYTYSVPLSASWQIDAFGRLRNAKERAKVLVENSYVYQRGIQAGLIATIATQYYTISMLREQAVIIDESANIWSETYRAMQLLKEAGQYSDAAVSQAEANYNSILASKVEIRQQIKEMENSLSVILGESIRSIETNSLTSWTNPKLIEVGIPVQLLSMRPDVMQAELALAAAFYTTNEARSEFYPNLMLSGSIGWSNIAGIVSNPGKLVWDALASLTQPVFQNGRLRAQYKIAKSQQEEAKLNFRQLLLEAGTEVNNAYGQVQSYSEKSVFYKNQVNSLERTVRSTKLLMESGSSNYLEVLTAQDNLLSAQLSLISNQYNEINSCISLYQALGGGAN